MRLIIATLLAGLLAGPLWAAPTPSGLPVPRFVTLKFGEAVGRSGPSEDHPEVWVYRRPGLPVQVVAETEVWRKVRDPLGDESWMHRRLLDGERSVMVMRETRLLRRGEAGADLVAIAEKGAILSLGVCEAGWCRVEAGPFEGWARAVDLWGVEADDEG